MKERKYKQQMNCRNCTYTFIKEFDKGISCEGFYECTKCGCQEAVAIGLPKTN